MDKEISEMAKPTSIDSVAQTIQENLTSEKVKRLVRHRHNRLASAYIFRESRRAHRH